MKTKKEKQENKRSSLRNLQNAVLAREYWVDDQYLGGYDPELHSNGTELATFFVAQSSFGGHISRLEGHKQ